MAGHDETYRERDLAIYLAARFFSEAAALAQSVAIGWTVYALSNAPLALGIVGIVQFVPMLLLALPAGELCDRLSPRRVVIIGLGLQSLCAVGFLALTMLSQPVLWPIYVLLLVFGAARAFTDPAGQALLPFLVPADRLPRAIAWGSSAWQVAVIAGPALGGFGLRHRPGSCVRDLRVRFSGGDAGGSGTQGAPASAGRKPEPQGPHDARGRGHWLYLVAADRARRDLA
jgi:MFS family permease